MNLDHDFVQMWKFSEDHKKKQMEHFFPQIQVKTKKKKSSSNIEHFLPQIYAQMYTHSNYWGDADVYHSQTIGGIQPNIGGIYPPILPSFGTPAYSSTLKLANYSFARQIYFSNTVHLSVFERDPFF